MPAGARTATAVLAGPGMPTVYAAAIIATCMVLLWLASIRIGDASIVDPFWGPAFVLVAGIVALTAPGCPGRRWLLLAVTALWGLRLGAHLTRRKLEEPGEDRRYRALREREGERFARWSLIAIFGTQGLLVMVVSLPIQVAAQQGGSLTIAVLPGVLLMLGGLVFESVADAQLRRFRADPGNGAAVMDRGLWRYTRHPNYFGDVCVWWGIWLIALPAGGTWWTLIGPVVMSVLLIRVSGKALLERDISQRRPGYADYIARTSGFLPKRPRRRPGQ